MEETNVILCIKIVRNQEGLTLSQSHYIEKMIKRFNHYDCVRASTLFDFSTKLTTNNGDSILQLEFSRLIGCLMYAMICAIHDVAFAIRKLSRYTSNLCHMHWHEIRRVLNYFKITINYSISYYRYPSSKRIYMDVVKIIPQLMGGFLCLNVVQFLRDQRNKYASQIPPCLWNLWYQITNVVLDSIIGVEAPPW